MPFRKFSDTPNDIGFAIDIETNRLARWDGTQFVVIADPAAQPLPEAPAGDGVYALLAVVEKGKATFVWEEQEPTASDGGEE